MAATLNKDAARAVAEDAGWVVLDPEEYSDLVTIRSAWVCGRWARERDRHEMLALREVLRRRHLPEVPAPLTDGAVRDFLLHVHGLPVPPNLVP